MVQNGGQQPGPRSPVISTVGNCGQQPLLTVGHLFQPWGFLETMRNLPLQKENLTWQELAFS